MRNNNEIGALWSKTSVRGEEYFSGKITVDGKSTKIVAFKVKYKNKYNSPDWIIYLSDRNEQGKDEKNIASRTDDDDVFSYWNDK